MVGYGQGVGCFSYPRGDGTTRGCAGVIAGGNWAAPSTLFRSRGRSAPRRTPVPITADVCCYAGLWPQLSQNGKRWLWVPAQGPGRRMIDSPLHERLLDHKMAGLAVAAFEEAARFEHLAQLFEHAGAAAHHDAVGLDVERRLMDIVEQLFRGDQVGDAAAVAERLARHGRIILQLLGQQRSEQFIVAEL